LQDYTSKEPLKKGREKLLLNHERHENNEKKFKTLFKTQNTRNTQKKALAKKNLEKAYLLFLTLGLSH